ncbi:Hpt domain-containing protein [Rhodovulum sp. 12E13]|uniref:Hpt domain-containing protein n=1 Tax=Rhodovulum sp. 12E13 TaxID=2203891 RepID=UPI000E1225F5|nr:Hpt domain-containing protein [Rhodovulum sp. 12E13]RDC73770.1 Hpt domain-containing protein [Rhodovulum sp. 12E13]
MSDGAGAPDPSPPDPSAIDWPRVADLRVEIGDDEFVEVLELFLTDSDEMVEALAGQPPSAYEEALHSLKGAALNMGLSGLAEICRQGERLAAEGRAEEVQIALVLTGYAAARAALVSGLQAGKGGG